MNEKQVRCFRCHGRKEIYEVNGGYTMINTGGVLVKCPLCSGVGKISVPDVENQEELKDEEKPTKKEVKKTTKKVASK